MFSIYVTFSQTQISLIFLLCILHMCNIQCWSVIYKYEQEASDLPLTPHLPHDYFLPINTILLLNQYKYAVTVQI